IDDDGDDDHPPVEIIKISVSPNPPVERANITIDAPTADTVTVQLVEKKFDMAGVYLYSEKIDSYKWRCFIPSNSADKFVYIQASNLEGGRGIYWSKAIQKNQTPPQKFELILDTYPFDLALKGVFKLYPDPVEILTPTDGRVHAVYEERTRVNITAQNYEDYVFEYWTGTGIKDTSSDNPLITLMNQDKEYIAHYKEKTEQHPTLSYSPKAYNFSDMLEGEIASATFKIWNNGTGTLNYNLSESAEWLSVSPSSGSSTGEQNKNTIEVYINTTNLSPGNYSANISIESNGGSGNFSVNLMVSSTPSSPVIKIITPNGGENWQIGGLYEIRWRSIGNVGEKVKIELYRGNNLFKILSTNISNVGNCKWVVSTDIPHGYDYRIKITSLDNEEIYDFSDGIFSLYTPSTLHFLFISSPPVCYEKLPFSVTVYDEEGNYVKNATVSFYGQSVRTDSKGKAPPIFAPSVDKDTPAFIIASKRGYVYATSTLLVKDVEKLIKIDTPEKVEEGKNFTIFVTFYNIVNQTPSYEPIPVRVKFGNQTKVNERGKVEFKAPTVDKDVKLPLTVYVDYFNVSTNATLLVENVESIGIIGKISKVFTQTWLILFTIIFLTLLIVFIIISFRSKKRKINIAAPVHVGSNDEFIVRVKDNRDRGVEDALVEFNGVTKRTDNRGIVKFKAPNLAEIKELYITVEKDNMKDSVPIMVGSISPHKELYPYVTPPSITEEEIQIFSPIDKKQLKATQAKQAQTEELPQISTASNEIINKLIDAVLEKHKRK
ncbi:MAG: hypothetical protein DRJ99_03645, partial [Thermoplasmata archaeon]